MTLPRSSRLRALALSAAAVGTAGIAAAPASAGVTLDWTTANVANSAAPADTERTWLGYVTNPSTRGGAKGTASPIAPATGSTVTPASARGVDQLATWSLPASAGSYNPAALSGQVQFRGGVSFVSPPFVSPTEGGHGFTITIENPRIVLNGDGTGALYASGSKPSGGPGSALIPYDETQPVFTLADARAAINWDGSQTVTAVPAVAATNYVFPGQYAAGAGPERTPNTFGSFAITLAADSGPKGDKGDTGAKGDKGDAGAKGDKGDAGKNGTTTTVRIQTSSLAKAPFKGKAARKVRVTAKGSKKVVATGTVKGRSLTVTLAKGKKQLKGTFVLRVVGKKANATVRIP